jgi:hypothetical protein
MENANVPPAAAAVRIGRGVEVHLAFNYGQPSAFCKGGRTHRARVLSLDLGKITCQVCRKRAAELFPFHPTLTK